MRRRRIISWTCSDFVHHEHRWKWSAWICSWVQMLWRGIASRRMESCFSLLILSWAAYILVLWRFFK